MITHNMLPVLKEQQIRSRCEQIANTLLAELIGRTIALTEFCLSAGVRLYN